MLREGILRTSTLPLEEGLVVLVELLGLLLGLLQGLDLAACRFGGVSTRWDGLEEIRCDD